MYVATGVPEDPGSVAPPPGLRLGLVIARSPQDRSRQGIGLAGTSRPQANKPPWVAADGGISACGSGSRQTSRVAAAHAQLSTICPLAGIAR